MYTMERQKIQALLYLMVMATEYLPIIIRYRIRQEERRLVSDTFYKDGDIVKMKNKYCGSKTLSFKIVPKATKITKVIKKKKALSISWKKQKKQVSGYQIQVSTSRKFKSKKTKNISGMKKNSTTVSKLKSRKKYYIRIRTWKKKNRKKYYSAWSKVKIGKTK